MPGTPPNQASMLCTLMAAARAKAAVFLRFINDDENELEMDDDDVDDDDDDDFMVLEDWFGHAPPPVAAAITNNNHVPPAIPRFTGAKVPRMKQYESSWWTRYLAPQMRADPNGRRLGKFHKLFHISYSVFLVLLDNLKRRWYQLGESTILAFLENLCRTLS
jgi:hypothetical protein